MGVSEQHVAPKSSQLRPTPGEEQSGGRGTPQPGTWGVGPDSPPGPCLGPPHPHQATLGP